MALSETLPDQPMRFRLRQIVEAAERAAFLTGQMLAYAGRGRFVTAMIDLSDLVREIAELVRTSIPKTVELKLELDTSLPRIEADPAQMQQVVMNLVINGAEAVEEKATGTVTVRTLVREVGAAEVADLFKSQPAEAGTYLILEVTDTGTGMDESTKARIFDPFFTTKFTRRGLGLAAVQGIVKRHRGAIFVHSTLGQGTTFRILLPASERKAAQNQSIEARADCIPTGAVALVIDDEKMVRSIAEGILSRKGMKVLTADHGRSGVEMFREYRNSISVVILDLQMPVMGGKRPWRSCMKSIPRFRLFYPAVSTKPRRFSSVKPTGFLQKPYTAQRLVSAVAAALKKR